MDILNILSELSALELVSVIPTYVTFNSTKRVIHATGGLLKLTPAYRCWLATEVALTAASTVAVVGAVGLGDLIGLLLSGAFIALEAADCDRPGFPAT